MSEITDDYYNDSDIQRVLVSAKAAQIGGSSTITGLPLLLNEDNLPDELIDSNESTADSSGAPTLRASSDVLGISQLALHIVNFTPAAGGAGGGATAEIYVEPFSLDGANGSDLYLWWNKSGKTQPAAGATYGSEAVYAAAEFVSTDGGITDHAGTYTPTNNGSSAGSQFKTGATSRDFDGTNDDIEISITEDATAYTMLAWVRPDNVASRSIIVRTDSSGPTVSWSHQLRITSGNKAEHYLFDEGETATVSVTGSTSLSTATWYMIVGAVSNGGTSKLYLNGSSEGTPAAVTTLWTAGDRAQIGNNSGDSMSHYDGHVENIWIWHEELSADQITTIYNNQNAPATFWDSTAAVEAGPFGPEDNPKFTWTFNGRERTWTVELFEQDFTGDTTTLCAGSEMRGRWGHTSNGFDERIRASELSLEVIDPDLELYNSLMDTTLSEEDFKIKMVDSTSTYTLRMRVRLDEVSTLLVDNLEEPVTSLYAYCTMADLKGIDAVITSSETIHDLFRLILVSSGIGQDIEYYVGHYAENAASSGALLDLHRLNRLDLIFAEEGRKIDTMYDQLRSLLEGFGLVAINGLDGQWHVKHEYALGEVKTDRGAQSYDFFGGSFSVMATLNQSVKTLENAIIGRGMTRVPVQPVQVVQAERGNSRDFITVDVVKHGDFEYGWVSSSEHEVWEAVEGSYSQSSSADTGSYSFALATGSHRADQDLIRLAGGNLDIDVEVAVRYSFESASASTARVGTSVLVPFYYNPETLDLKRGSGGSDWDQILGAVTLDTGMVANGDSLIWTTLVTTIYGPLPDFDGQLEISFQSSLANYTARIDTLEVRLKKGDKATNQFRSVTGRYDLNGNLIGAGGVVEQVVPWYNGVLGVDLTNEDTSAGDPLDNATRDSVHEMVQVLTTAAGTWIQASQFKTFIPGYTTRQDDDLFDLTAEIRIKRQENTLEAIEGEVLGIVPHEQPVQKGDKTYLQQYTEIDFRREVTRFVAYEKLGLVAADAAPTTVYYARDKAYRKVTIAASTPWTSSAMDAPTTGRSVDSIKVDEAEGFLFGLEYLDVDTNDKWLTKRSTSDGSLIDTIVNWNGTSFTANGFALARIRGRIYVAEEENSGAASRIRSFDYSGTSTGTIVSSSDGYISPVGVSSDEKYLFYRIKKLGLGPYDRLRRYNFDTGADDIIATSFTNNQSTGTALDVMHPDADTSDNNEGIFLNAFTNITKFPYPDAGSESTVTTNPNNNALGIDRSNEKLYYAGTSVQYKMRRIGYDGSGDEEVMDEGTGNDIISIDLGYN